MPSVCATSSSCSCFDMVDGRDEEDPVDGSSGGSSDCRSGRRRNPDRDRDDRRRLAASQLRRLLLLATLGSVVLATTQRRTTSFLPSSSATTFLRNNDDEKKIDADADDSSGTVTTTAAAITGNRRSKKKTKTNKKNGGTTMNAIAKSRVGDEADAPSVGNINSNDNNSTNRILLLHVGKSGGGTIGTLAWNRWTSLHRRGRQSGASSAPRDDSDHATTKRQQQIARRAYRKCHPNPCPDALREFVLGRSDNGGDSDDDDNEGQRRDVVLLTVRDPVDRFVSAFRWRQQLLCDNFSGVERRKPGKPMNFGGLASPFCIEPRKGDANGLAERRVLLGPKYNRSVDVLARALCRDKDDTTSNNGNRGNDNNKNATEEALNDMKLIKHSQYSMSEWLRIGDSGADAGATDAGGAEPNSTEENRLPWWRQNAKKKAVLYPIVLEPPFDLEVQVEEAVFYAYGRSSSSSSTPPKSRSDSQEENYRSRAVFAHSRHSSGTTKGATSSKKTKRGGLTTQLLSLSLLSDRGRECVAQYYAEDYEVLERLLDDGGDDGAASTAVCGDGTICRDAIRSILNRRRPI